jgi:ubiquinone/menaquinone biosynthesis C-methylase UbiE
MSGPVDDIQRQSRDQFGKQSHRYASGHILSNTSDVEEAVRRMALPKRAQVLDVAAAAGFTGLYLARLGHDVTLADIAPQMLERAREKAQESGVEVQLCEHAAEQMPYEANRFDLVTCRVAAHHFSSPAAFIQETWRVLVPGGFFLLIDGTVPDGSPVAEEWMHQVEKLRDPSHHRFLTPGSWSHLCEEAGMRVEHVGLSPFQQPDLNWYFETAATSAENRVKVLDLVRNAPVQAREMFQLEVHGEKIIWWWQRLTLIARKAA